MKCNRCKQYGMYFERQYSPSEYFEGDLNSDIWIVGINPAGDPGRNDGRSLDELRHYFDEMQMVHSYFKSFEHVSPHIYNSFGKEGGVGHTDIVKCYSNKFPPDGSAHSGRAIVENCMPYFREQLSRHCPKMIICNGTSVCKTITKAVPKIGGRALDTYYFGNVNGKTVIVVLSGFIGRIDNYSRRRLGLEIEELLKEIGWNA